jgi:hypothetical protein
MYKIRIRLFMALCLTVAVSFFSSGQGCSDAGFCTLNGFKPDADSAMKEYKNYAAIGLSHGEADHGIAIWNSYVEVHRQFSAKLGLNMKISGMSQSGNAVSAIGLSDIYLNGSYSFLKNTTALLGFKIPLQDGNRQGSEGLPLPMDYQSSLGTFDVIAGLKYEIKKLVITAGYQQPLVQNNNQFLSAQYPMGSPLKNFQSTNNYQRSGDVLLRLSYPFKITKQLTVTPSVLPIYHLKNDRYTDETGMKQTITGSQGLTLNGTLYLDYTLSERSSLNLNAGKPFITRKVRPDGLTREYILTLEYKFKF